jgi:hypothetical protein
MKLFRLSKLEAVTSPTNSPSLARQYAGSPSYPWSVLPSKIVRKPMSLSLSARICATFGGVSSAECAKRGTGAVSRGPKIIARAVRRNRPASRVNQLRNRAMSLTMSMITRESSGSLAAQRFEIRAFEARPSGGLDRLRTQVAQGALRPIRGGGGHREVPGPRGKPRDFASGCGRVSDHNGLGQGACRGAIVDGVSG